MEQLKLYITLLRHNCATIADQVLEELHNSNRVFYFDEGNSIIFLDGNWWNDFITSHTLGVCDAVMLHLRTRFNANRIHLVYRNRPTAGFIWNDNAKMYLGDGGYCRGE